jgi:hypothetical protein
LKNPVPGWALAGLTRAGLGGLRALSLSLHITSNNTQLFMETKFTTEKDYKFLHKLAREWGLPGVLKTPGVLGRVSEGKGQGRDFCTLDKPLPLAGVRGIPLENPCPGKAQKYSYICIFYLKNCIFSIQNLFLTYIKAYYIESDLINILYCLK